MSSSNAITSEQIEVTQIWVRRIYEMLDSSTFNVEQWLNEFFQTDVVLNIGSQICLKGFENVAAHFRKDHQQNKVRHDVKHIDVLFDRIYVRLDATFIIKHDPEQKEITVNVLSLIRKRIDENKISSAHVFVDRTPVNERLKLLSVK